MSNDENSQGKSRRRSTGGLSVDDILGADFAAKIAKPPATMGSQVSSSAPSPEVALPATAAPADVEEALAIPALASPSPPAPLPSAAKSDVVLPLPPSFTPASSPALGSVSTAGRITPPVAIDDEATHVSSEQPQPVTAPIPVTTPVKVPPAVEPVIPSPLEFADAEDTAPESMRSDPAPSAIKDADPKTASSEQPDSAAQIAPVVSDLASTDLGEPTVVDDAVSVSDDEILGAPNKAALAAAKSVLAAGRPTAPIAVIAGDEVTVPASGPIVTPTEQAQAEPPRAGDTVIIQPGPALGDDDAVVVSEEERIAAPSAEALAIASATIAEVPPTGAAPDGSPWAASSESSAGAANASPAVPGRISTTELHDLALPDRLPPFPLASVLTAGRDMGSYLLSLPILYKGVAVVFIAGCFGVAWVLFADGLPREAYLSGTSVASMGPGNKAFEGGVEIERNTLVNVLAEERVDGALLSLVRDDIGQVGWVAASMLSTEALPTTPENEFSRCRRRPTEAKGAACQQRVAQQLDACVDHCATLEEPQPCNKLCDKRSRDCLEICAVPYAKKAESKPCADSGTVNLFDPVPAATAKPVPEAVKVAPKAAKEPAPAKASGKKKRKRRKRKKR